MAGGEERPSGGGDDKKRYPAGFRFQPTLQELVEFYLLPKLLDQPTVPNDAVIEADAYECDPEILTKKYEERGADDNWFFLSPRSRRYPGGDRPTRRTADNRGRWKPSTGQSKTGKNAGAGHSKGKKGSAKNLSVGAIEFTENTLAYYVGEPKDEAKTKWLMHEVTVPEPEKEKEPHGTTGEKPRNHMLLNKYVMCNIYKSPLKKWKQREDEAGCSTSSAPALDEDVPSSSQSGPSPPESSGEASAPATSSKREGKRPASEQPSGHSIVPNKRGSQHQMTMAMPSGRPVPAHGNGGGMGAPSPVGAAAGYYHGVPGLPPLMQWPPAMCSSMQGPVQLQQRPQLVYRHNRLPPVQEPPVLKLHPPHRVSATGPGPRGPTMTMHPPNQVAGQPVQAPSFTQQPQQQQQVMMPKMTPYEQRVLMQLLAEIKLHRGLQESAPCAGQQQATPTATPTQLAWFDEGASHPAAAATGLVPYPQFLASHNFYPFSDVQLQQQYQQQQQQQSSSAIPTASVPPGAAAPVEATPVDDNAPSKLPEVPSQEMQTKEAGTATTIASNLSQIWPL